MFYELDQLLRFGLLKLNLNTIKVSGVFQILIDMLFIFWLWRKQCDVAADTRHSKSGVTALMVACWHGDMDSVDKLLQCGADPKLAAPNNMTCFDFAQKNNHKELCSFLNKFVLKFKYEKVK